MQGISGADRDLRDACEVAGHLVPPGSVFAFLAQHRRELFPGSFTADLFGSRTGRPSLPADLVGSVLVLKEVALELELLGFREQQHILHQEPLFRG